MRNLIAVHTVACYLGIIILAVVTMDPVLWLSVATYPVAYYMGWRMARG